MRGVYALFLSLPSPKGEGKVRALFDIDTNIQRLLGRPLTGVLFTHRSGVGPMLFLTVIT